jgi:PST family polysaccharide transporter
MVVLARLVDPKDFGLVAMVAVPIGILSLFRECGLSTASVQQVSITSEQVSTLFWINVGVGVALAVVTVAVGPALVHFYGDPRLFPVAAVLASGFVFGALGVQHSALLQRQMRFSLLGAIDVGALAVSVALGILLAREGFRYWALVGMSVTTPMVATTCLWFVTSWIPSRPRRGVGVRPMLRLGSGLTLNGVVVYIGYNLEKVLLGRFWGAEAVGLYSRAYQLINLPTETLSGALGRLMLALLARVQADPSCLRGYFLNGYSVALAVTIPVTVACGVLADDLIWFVLGPKWTEAVRVFQLLAPAALVFGVINPLSWLMFSLGMVRRSVKAGVVIAAVAVLACLVGLRYGPAGVAAAYSIALAGWVVPHIAWCVRGTGVSLQDVLSVVRRPLVSAIAAAGFVLMVQAFHGEAPALAALMVKGTVFAGVYSTMLLVVMGEGPFYLRALKVLRGGVSADEGALASV